MAKSKKPYVDKLLKKVFPGQNINKLDPYDWDNKTVEEVYKQLWRPFRYRLTKFEKGQKDYLSPALTRLKLAGIPSKKTKPEEMRDDLYTIIDFLKSKTSRYTVAQNYLRTSIKSFLGIDLGDVEALAEIFGEEVNKKLEDNPELDFSEELKNTAEYFFANEVEAFEIIRELKGWKWIKAIGSEEVKKKIHKYAVAGLSQSDIIDKVIEWGDNLLKQRAKEWAVGLNKRR